MERNIVSMGGPPPERDQPYMGDKKKICCREKIILKKKEFWKNQF
jgi:hypothetical protein